MLPTSCPPCPASITIRLIFRPRARIMDSSFAERLAGNPILSGGVGGNGAVSGAGSATAGGGAGVATATLRVDRGGLPGTVFFTRDNGSFRGAFGVGRLADSVAGGSSVGTTVFRRSADSVTGAGAGGWNARGGGGATTTGSSILAGVRATS